MFLVTRNQSYKESESLGRDYPFTEYPLGIWDFFFFLIISVHKEKALVHLLVSLKKKISDITELN